MLVTGDCTCNICVSDFVVATLSARNHGLLAGGSRRRPRSPTSTPSPACGWLCWPTPARRSTPPASTSAPPHVGLWLMATRGASSPSSWEP
ncbi:MAG: hypothetical protein R3F43_07150 [bacterium]